MSIDTAKNEKLVIGSAGKKHADSITVDIDQTHNPDVVHDLNNIPWPFEDNQFKEITAHHVLEHLDDLTPIMDEFYRVCSADGVIYIEVPHHSSWCANTPSHKLRFNVFAFDPWCKEDDTWRTGKKFEMVKKELSFHRRFRRLFLHKYFNAKPMNYERFWTFICPAEHLKIWLRPKKK